jgi:hypothetical protein
VTFAQIKARRTTECVVMNPWPHQSLNLLEQPANTPVAAVQANGKYSFAAEAGKTYLLQPSMP